MHPQLAVVSQQAGENELVRGPSRKWLRDGEQSTEPIGVARHDHDQALSRPRGTILRRQRRFLAKDRLLELLQGRAGLDAQLVDEQTARVPIDLERLGLSTGTVERSHQRRAKPLTQRVRVNEHFELRDEPGVSAQREVGVDAPLEGVHPELFEAEDLGLRERRVRQVCKRRSSPQAERVAEQSRCQLGRGLLRLLYQPLEAEQVEFVWAHTDHVAGVLREDRVARSERLA